MARRKDQPQENDQPQAIRHPLLVYYNLGKRYRAPGVLLFLVGPFFFLPSLSSDLDKGIIDADALAIIGGVIMLSGLGLWLFSVLARRRAYVLCRPDVLEIHAPFYRTVVSYLRIKQVLSVQVSQLFPRESLKGSTKPLMVPLVGMTAVEMYLTSWPKPKKRLMRYFSRYLFSPRAEAWVFIVPNYSILARQIEDARQRHGEQASGKSTAYEDPFERLKYYQK